MGALSFAILLVVVVCLFPEGGGGGGEWYLPRCLSYGVVDDDYFIDFGRNWLSGEVIFDTSSH